MWPPFLPSLNKYRILFRRLNSECLRNDTRYIDNRKTTNGPLHSPNISCILSVIYRVGQKVSPSDLSINRCIHQKSTVILIFIVLYFYPNVTTLRSGLCCRNSVCLSVVCLSVTLVHPTQVVEPFGKISSPLCTLAIL